MCSIKYDMKYNKWYKNIKYECTMYTIEMHEVKTIKYTYMYKKIIVNYWALMASFVSIK